MHIKTQNKYDTERGCLDGMKKPMDETKRKQTSFTN